jgi:uncharacterized protein (TIGR02147 family)
MQNIFEYIDYRTFLADYYQDKKATTPYFSYRYFSQKTGVNSPSFLKNVIEGKRNLTINMAERFAKALGFKAKEKAYFLNLISFNQAKTLNEKQVCYNLLRTISKRVKESVIKGDQYDFFSNWYVAAIRELICLRNFNDDFDLLAAAVEPAIDPALAKASVELLLRLKMVEKTKSGIYKQTSTALSVDDSVTSMAVRTFTRTMIDHSKNSLEAISKENRHISGITMGISKKSYDIMIKEIEAFKDRLKIIVAHDNAANSVYQINLALFPISKTQETGSSDSEIISLPKV